MKYIIIANSQNIRVPLNCNGKIIYFDTKEEAEDLTNNSYLSIQKDALEISTIEYSRINNNKYINYKEAVKLLAWT